MKSLVFILSAIAALMFGACVSQTTGYSVTAYAPKNPSNVRVKLSLSTQNLYVLEGDRLLMAVQGCVGKPGTPTPTGDYHIFSKQKERRRQSEPDAGYPMAYWCEFAPAYGFHEGFVWSVPHTHGCVRLHKQAAARLFALVHVGTPVNIAHSQPEDRVYASQVRRLDQSRDPDPPRSVMMSASWFKDPPGPLLIQ